MPAPRFQSPPPDSAPARLSAVPAPAEPWAQDARAAAGKLAAVPAFVPRVVPRVPPPGAPSCAAARGLHRPRSARRDTSVVLAVAAAAVALAALIGAMP